MAGDARRDRNFYRAMPKDLRVLAKKCVKSGGEVSIGGSGHLHWVAPDGYEFTSSCTPRSPRERNRIRALLRKHGCG